MDQINSTMTGLMHERFKLDLHLRNPYFDISEIRYDCLLRIRELASVSSFMENYMSKSTGSRKSLHGPTDADLMMMLIVNFVFCNHPTYCKPRDYESVMTSKMYASDGSKTDGSFKIKKSPREESYWCTWNVLKEQDTAVDLAFASGLYNVFSVGVCFFHFVKKYKTTASDCRLLLQTPDGSKLESLLGKLSIGDGQSG